MLIRLLLCLRPRSIEDRFERLLRDTDCLVEAARGQRSRLWTQSLRRCGDVVIVSRDLVPEPVVDNLHALRSTPESPSVVLVVDRDDVDDRAALLAAGADEVLAPDLDDGVLRDLLLALVERRRDVSAERLRIAHPGGEPRLTDFVSRSPSMRAFLDVVHRVVDSDSSLLLLGETGVGKERLARAIHADSRRASGPFVAVNCGAIPETLLESELFGHEKGAFTGASRARRGWFELGHGGTVFLDEVGDMPAHLQIKLLRVLQEHEIQPLGGERAIRIDVRIMAASNRDLEQDVAAKAFRKDLYYRLSVVTLEVPSLRTRREDIDTLVENYVEYYAQTIGRDVEGIENGALDALRDYDWPGNVRELMNVMERAVLLCEEDDISIADLPEVIRRGAPEPPSAAPEVTDVRRATRRGVPPEWLARPLVEVRRQVVRDTERAYLAALLAETGGRIAATAARAGIGPRALNEKMRRLGLRKEDFKTGR
jgi:DNA-binding NtrC family response regulator